VSNDPDLLDEECRDCNGRGERFVETENVGTWWETDVWDQCATCSGGGRVLRG
jgi:DnaJ-class molecular chaperone